MENILRKDVGKFQEELNALGGQSGWIDLLFDDTTNYRILAEECNGLIGDKLIAKLKELGVQFKD